MERSVCVDPKAKQRDLILFRFQRAQQAYNSGYIPLPRVVDILDSFHGVKYMSTFDLSKGYWQLPLAKESRPLMAFSVRGKKVKFTCMPMGLTNASAVFQRTMNIELAELLWSTCFAYLDDMMVTGTTRKNHIRNMRDYRYDKEESYSKHA